MNSPATRSLHLLDLKGLFPRDALALLALSRRLAAGGKPCLGLVADAFAGGSVAKARTVVARLVEAGLLMHTATARAREVARRLSVDLTEEGRALVASLSAQPEASASSSAAPTPSASVDARVRPALPLTPEEHRALDNLPARLAEEIATAAAAGTDPDLDRWVRAGALPEDRAARIESHLARRVAHLASTAVAAQSRPRIEETRVPLAGPEAIDAARAQGYDVPEVEAGVAGEEVARYARHLLAEACARAPKALRTLRERLGEIAFACVSGELADLGHTSRRVRTALKLVREGRWRTPKSLASAPKGPLLVLRPSAGGTCAAVAA